MKTFLLDTNAASALFDSLHLNHDKAVLFIKSLGGSHICIPCIVWAEIRYGYKVHKIVDPARKALIEDEMSKFAVMRIDKHTTGPYSDIRSQLFHRFANKDGRDKVRQKHPEDLTEKTTGKSLGIQENDLWIVAIAIQYNMGLITDDRMTRIRETVKGVQLDFYNWKTDKTIS